MVRRKEQHHKKVLVFTTKPEFRRFRKKTENRCKKSPKIMLVDEKSALGRSCVALFYYFARFLMVRKNDDFSISIRRVTKSIKIEHWVLKGLDRHIGDRTKGPFVSPGAPQARPARVYR